MPKDGNDSVFSAPFVSDGLSSTSKTENIHGQTIVTIEGTEYIVSDLLLRREDVDQRNKSLIQVWGGIYQDVERKRDAFPMMVTRRISLEKIGDLQNKKFPESKFFVDFWHREKYREKLTVPILDEKGGPVDGKSQERFHKRDCYCEAAYYRYKPAVSLAEVTGNQMHLIPEFIKKGIKDGGFRKRFDERFIKYILVSVGQALSLLHESRIAYGNLRPDTISLTTDLNVILPRICYIEPQFSDSFRWRSPELVQMYNSISSESTISSKSQKNMEKKFASDVWAFGCVASFLATGLVPFHGEDDPSSIGTQFQIFLHSKGYAQLGVRAEVYRSDRCSLESLWNINAINNPFLRDVVRQCLSLDYSQRPSIKSILSMDFFTTPLIGSVDFAPLTALRADIKENLFADEKSELAKVVAQHMNKEYLDEISTLVLVKNALLVSDITAVRTTYDKSFTESYLRSIGEEFSNTILIASEPLNTELKIQRRCCAAYVEGIMIATSDDQCDNIAIEALSSLFGDYNTIPLYRQLQQSFLNYLARSIKKKYEGNWDSWETLETAQDIKSDRASYQIIARKHVPECHSDDEEHVIQAEMLSVDCNCFRRSDTTTDTGVEYADYRPVMDRCSVNITAGKKRYVLLSIILVAFLAVVLTVVLLAVFLTRR